MSQSLEALEDQMKDQFGDSAPFRGENRERLKIEWMSTGLLSVDMATQPNSGSGGIPRGRIVESYGPQQSGKTSLALSTIAEEQEYQKQKPEEEQQFCAFFDNENAYNPHFSEMMGVDTDRMWFNKISEGELTYDQIEAMVKTGKFSLIVIDSLAGLAPLPELQNDMGDQHMGLAGKLNSKAMRKLCSTLGNNDCTLFIINQLRENVGQMFGNPEVTPGGKSLRYVA